MNQIADGNKIKSTPKKKQQHTHAFVHKLVCISCSNLLGFIELRIIYTNCCPCNVGYTQTWMYIGLPAYQAYKIQKYLLKQLLRTIAK